MSHSSVSDFQRIEQGALDSYLLKISAEQVPSGHLGNPPSPSWDFGSTYPNFDAAGGTTNFDDSQASVNLHVDGSGPPSQVIAYIINLQGSIFPIMGEAQPQNIEGYSQLHFLGFLIQDDAMTTVKPFFVSITR